MSASHHQPRAVDHLVLPTVGLEVARARLVSLGFTVAPVGIHPFGTANCCVFLADGTYLEPLAVADSAAAETAIASGNVFVARDASFRQVAGDEGLSAVVLSTDDAAADHDRFEQAGISAGSMLDFSRAFVDPAGNSAVASFRLAFATEASSPAAFAFSCQRINPPPADRTVLQAHDNGAVALSSIVAVSDDPAASAAFLANVGQTTVMVALGATGRHPGTQDERSEGCVSGTHSATVSVRNASIEILDADAYLHRHGRPAPKGSGLRYAAIRFTVADIGATKALLRQRQVAFTSSGADILVASAPGQGVDFLFGEDN
jgi:hypothetical protein